MAWAKAGLPWLQGQPACTLLPHPNRPQTSVSQSQPAHAVPLPRPPPPALFSYITILKQEHSAAAAGIVQSVTHLMQGTFTQLTPLALQSIGLGAFLSITSAGVFAASALALAFIVRRLAGGRAQAAGARAPGLAAAAAAAVGAVPLLGAVERLQA
jgi:hypothetical protein